MGNWNFPKDWSNKDQVFLFLTEIAEDTWSPDSFVEWVRRGDVSVEMALAWLQKFGNSDFQDKESYLRRCMELLYYDVRTHEQRVLVMNQPRLFGMLSDNQRRSMYEAVLENGDLSQLGVWWTQCFQYIDDVIAMNKLIKKRLTRTHSVECIMEMGDRTCMEADELLLSRIMSGAEPEEDCSVRTADFIRAAQVLLTHLLPHVAVGVASELILKLVGAQTSRDREIGMDEVRRPAHEKLATVKMLMDRIIEMMTPENAGVVLRWTLPLKGRHRYFIWNQLKDALRRNHWRMIKVRQMGRELGVEWQTSGGAIRVLPTREQATRFGSLRPDVLVMVPGHRELDFLGIVESIGIPLGTKTWRGPIHPIHRPTSWMQEHPMI